MEEINATAAAETREEITITERAAAEILRVKTTNNIPEEHGLRLGVKGGGCSGLSYVLGFDEKSREGDKILLVNGIKVYIDPKSLFFIAGTQLDFENGLNGHGFIFNNPNARQSCGCGHSFSA